MTKLAFSLPPGERFDLTQIDAGFTAGYEKKKRAKQALADNLDELHALQEKLYADGSKALLIVLQAMDTAGKDGTIKHVMGAFNPQGVQVAPFKVPSEEERNHDYLWRVHKRVPQNGLIGIFNRSHYEEVLVVRVKQLVPEEVWRKRYEHINSFEKLLADSGVHIVKLFLHISPDEQAERLRDRQQIPDKRWKFSPGDLEDRKLWHEYQRAYEDALTRCNTAHAPWWVVPANRKWFRNLAVSDILIRAMKDMDCRYPDPAEQVESYSIPEV